MSLTIEDKQYIEGSIKGAIRENNSVIFKQFKSELLQHKKDTEQYMGALREGFTDQVKMLAELIKERPTRSEVVDMIQDYTPQIVKQETYKIFQSELGPILAELRETNRKMDKRILNSERRIDHLELAAQN